MLKRLVSTMLVTGVLAATIVVPVLAAPDLRPSPDKPRINDQAGQNVSQSVSLSGLSSGSELGSSAKSNMVYEESYTKPGMGYFIFDADQWTGGHLWVSDALKEVDQHGVR